MTQFNQELITKARKGEIAILNDGGAENLNIIMEEVKPGTAKHNGFFKYYKLSEADWYKSDDSTFLRCPIKSVKDFFMPDTTINHGDLNGTNETVVSDSPRTYKVTRSQMKEIWEAAHNKNPIRKLAEEYFAVFAEDIQIDDALLLTMRHCFNQEKPEVLVKHFPSFFFIPEGEPVLVRNTPEEPWTIFISDGKGGVYNSGLLYGRTVRYYQIIPFTKNPPK